MNEHIIHNTSNTINDPHQKVSSHETMAKDCHPEEEEETVREMTAEGWNTFFRDETASGQVMRLFSRRKLA